MTQTNSAVMVPIIADGVASFPNANHFCAWNRDDRCGMVLGKE